MQAALEPKKLFIDAIFVLLAALGSVAFSADANGHPSWLIAAGIMLGIALASFLVSAFIRSLPAAFLASFVISQSMLILSLAFPVFFAPPEIGDDIRSFGPLALFGFLFGAPIAMLGSLGCVRFASRLYQFKTSGSQNVDTNARISCTAKLFFGW